MRHPAPEEEGENEPNEMSERTVTFSFTTLFHFFILDCANVRFEDDLNAM